MFLRAAFIGLLTLLSVQARAETIILAADIWCPYNCSDGGYVIEIARDIFKKHNITVEYNVMPWKEAIEKTREGQADAIVGATHDDAPDFIYPTALQGMSDPRFWVLEDSEWTYSDPASLSGIKLGVIEDYAYSTALNTYIKQYAADEKRIYIAKGNNALTENLEKLKDRELGTVVEDYNVVNYLVTTQSAEYPIKSAGTPTKKEDAASGYLYIAFSPKNPKSAQYAAMLNAGMKQLRDSGELKKILEIYHVNDWYGITKK